MTDDNNKIYNLFSNRKYKTLYKLVKDNPKIIFEPLKNNKNLISYVIQSNNIRLLKKLLILNKDLLFYQDNNKLYLPYIALKADLYDLFFFLLDETIKADTKKAEDIFNVSFLLENSQLFIRLTDYVILKKDINLLIKYFDKYEKIIKWNKDNIPILSNLINDYFNLDEVIKIIKILIKDIKKEDIEDILKYPLNKLIKMYYNQTEKQEVSKKVINSDQIKKYLLIYPLQINYSLEYNITCIYTISRYNDIDMLQFCIDNGANLNHTTHAGSNNFTHYIMADCNLKLIEYILNLNKEINYNFKNYNNETPIFRLLKNPNILLNDDKSIALISKLLEKTDNWDIQNIYGNTVIHLLVIMTDIEKFYPILKTKYFDINIKNKYKISPLTLLKNKLKDLKDVKDIKDKIKEFKNLVIKNYKKKLEILKDDIPEDVKTNCLNNEDKCIDIIDKSLFTDLDYLSKDYQTLYLEDYEYSYYNIYNSRITDMYIYNILLLNKYSIIGMPISNNFDESTSLKKSSTLDENTMGYYFIERYKKYPSMYAKTIFWKNSKIFYIPYNIVEATINTINTGKKIIFINISIENNGLHYNILLIDTYNKRIIRFEPHGGINIVENLDDKLIKMYKDNKYFKDYKYYKPSDYQLTNGFQNISQELDIFIKRRGDIGGYCLAWSMWFTEFYIKNIDNGYMSDKKFNMLVPKVIKKMINTGYLFSEYIRNYANYLHNKLVEFLLNENVPYKAIYYTSYSDTGLDHLYELIHSKFLII